MASRAGGTCPSTASIRGAVELRRGGCARVYCPQRWHRRCGHRGGGQVGHWEVTCRKEPARRITDTSRMGLKTQLKLVKLKKELSVQREPKTVVRTSHRKKKLSAEERQHHRAEAERVEAEERNMARISFRSLFGSDGLANPPYLLVDGYNVIFEARAVNGQSRGQMDSDLLDTYRRDLELNLTNFSHKRGMKIILVFDAMNGANRQSTVTECTKAGLDVVWSGKMEADTYISTKVSDLYAQGVPYVFVVSNDVTLQTTSRANNAYIVTGRRLIREMRQADKETQEAMQAAKHDARRRGAGQLRNQLPSSTFAKLEQMRLA
eukprot:jgi/Tetstr1/423874/TSEL_014498.t1